ncbi:MAG TPA: hypothetical protein VIY71_02170 [Solirubrobacterales bacterium]
MIALASTPVELPANTVAIVSEVPRRTGTITKAEFHHALAQAAAQAGRKSTPKPGGNGYGKLKEVAIGESLDTVWIKGQAAEMVIEVTHQKVSRELARLKKQAFKSEAEYHRFLKESHFTRRDVRERVEVQLLSTAIQRRVVRGLSGEAAKQKAFSDFVDAYSKRWRARTVCAPEYAIDRCSNGPPSSVDSDRSTPVRRE